ncbi:hypothetical protein ABPG75_003040 [Micractinium tetrahymenae]
MAFEAALQAYNPDNQQALPLPEQTQAGAFRLEVLCRAFAALLEVSNACWQRSNMDAEAPDSGSGGSGSGGSGASSSAGGDRSGSSPKSLRDSAASCMDGLLGTWSAAVALAGDREQHVDPVLRLTTCALGAVHAVLAHMNSLPSSGAAGEQALGYSFGSGRQLADPAEMAMAALALVLLLAPPEEMGAGSGPGSGHLSATPATRRAAASFEPFPVWRHAAAVVPFLEQANRLLPLLQWATQGGGRGAVRASWQQLSNLFSRLPTCCTLLCFMMTNQRPQHGDGSPELERRLVSMAATGAKLGRFLEATGYQGPMWRYLYPAMGQCMSWIADLRVVQGGPSPQEQEDVWRGMHQPSGKAAALVHVYAEVWPLAQRHQVGDTFNEEGALAAALLANVAGLPMARCGGMKVVAHQLQRCKDTFSLYFLFRITAALRYAGEAETDLYCWYARDGHAQKQRSITQDYVFSVTLRTARKADELTGSRLGQDIERWLEAQVVRHPVMDTMLAQPSFWRALRRTHIPAILAALRNAPNAGCEPAEPAEAAAQRDRACAWLGCGNPGCINLAGASEAALPVLRCARCRVVGYCGPTCQRASWAHHKLACQLLSEPSDEHWKPESRQLDAARGRVMQECLSYVAAVAAGTRSGDTSDCFPSQWSSVLPGAQRLAALLRQHWAQHTDEAARAASL